MKTDSPTDTSPVEIIDIIDDDVDPFGERSQNTTIHDRGGPRWIGPTAAVALVALIGYGVVTSASNSSVPKVAPAPSTTAAPATTQPAPSTTEPRPPVPYYSADPPREFRVQFVDVDTATRSRVDPSGYQLWAMPGASATSGAWFSIESLRIGEQHIYAVGAFRVATGGQTMAITHLPSGVSTIQFGIDDGMSVTITSLGWADADLVRLAQSLTISDGTPGNDVRPSDPTLIDDFQLISTSQPFVALIGDSIEQVYYSDGTDPNGFSIGVARLLDSGGSVSAADRDTAQRFFLERATPFEVDGHSAVAGQVVGQPDFVIASWIAGDHLVSVIGTMPLAQLITIARTVHPVSSDEWDGMKFQASRNGTQFDSAFVDSGSHVVSSGVDSDGTNWNVSVSMSSSSDNDHRVVNWQWLSGGYGTAPHDIVDITPVVDGDRTYVLAELPRGIAATAQLQVTPTGFEPVVIPFTDVDPALDRTFAAYSFGEATDYTAQVIGADGAVLATWPTQ